MVNLLDVSRNVENIQNDVVASVMCLLVILSLLTGASIRQSPWQHTCILMFRQAMAVNGMSLSWHWAVASLTNMLWLWLAHRWLITLIVFWGMLLLMHVPTVVRVWVGNCSSFCKASGIVYSYPNHNAGLSTNLCWSKTKSSPSAIILSL